MSCRLLETELGVINIRTRIPFRYGIAVVTAVPHLIVRAEAEINGKRVHGYSADNLAPKWFTKNPDESYEHEVSDMFRVIEHASSVAVAVGSAADVFTLWEQTYLAQAEWGKALGLPLLLLQFGVSLVERAMIDAYCRAEGRSFADALDGGEFGIRLGAIHPELEGASPLGFLPKKPLSEIAVRHTVGMADPLTPSEITDSIDDGLPLDLESVIRHYGVRYFKLKVGGNVKKDTERLTRILEIIQKNRGLDFAFTIDGNEQYADIESVRALWEGLCSTLGKSVMDRLLFIEQPLHRDEALNEGINAPLEQWRGRPPFVIDESDAGFSAVRTALSMGYSGTSHKNCKGIFKGVANACLLSHRQRTTGQATLLSGEDLTNAGPVGLLQDLCVMARLGLSHVERNGYHYIKGLSFLPQEGQDITLKNHPDIFTVAEDGSKILRIENGVIKVGSLQSPSLGMASEFDLRWCTPWKQWTLDSLQAC